MAYLKNHSEVEDLMQATYLKAFQKLGKFQQQCSLKTWLTRIMINECLMDLRRKKARQALFVKSVKRSADAAERCSPEERLENKESAELAAKMIAKLPEEYRIVFVLKEIQKLSSKEIAAVTGTTEQNVRTRLLRAKRKLQKIITACLGAAELFHYDKKYCQAFTGRIMEKSNRFLCNEMDGAASNV
jgi:RNA polymerase sigma factor (sigma-70 family)